MFTNGEREFNLRDQPDHDKHRNLAGCENGCKNSFLLDSNNKGPKFRALSIITNVLDLKSFAKKLLCLFFIFSGKLSIIELCFLERRLKRYEDIFLKSIESIMR